MSVMTAVEARLVRSVLGLPERVQRALAGPPFLRDGQILAVDLQLMLRLQRLARKRSMVAGVTIEQGRKDMSSGAAIVGGDQPIGAVRDLTVAGLPARHYLPHGARSTSSAQPVLLFFHGGGFIYGDLDSHDAPCRVVAEESGVPVLSVAWGLGPERPFPGGFDDAEAALRWVVEHAAELGVDPDRIGVAGDSAGGKVAAWLAIMAARSGIPLAFQLLVYPAAQPEYDSESRRLFGEGLYLTSDFMTEVEDIYLPTPAERADERIALLETVLPSGLAPALVVTAGFDPLRDEGEAYARRLVESGASVELKRYPDQIHGFFNIVGVGRSSRSAVLEIAAKVRAALA
ncbi:MAG: alpha/beta hydrolase [Propionibacteriales bacterium]|nr:alpha/beta hydrolase [Propionibacteriales bacterium]